MKVSPEKTPFLGQNGQFSDHNGLSFETDLEGGLIKQSRKRHNFMFKRTWEMKKSVFNPTFTPISEALVPKFSENGTPLEEIPGEKSPKSPKSPVNFSEVYCRLKIKEGNSDFPGLKSDNLDLKLGVNEGG